MFGLRGSTVRGGGLLARARPAPDPLPSQHPKSKNGVGGYPINSIDRLHDNTNPLYLWARVADVMAAQHIGWFTSSARASTLPDWQSIIAANPFIYVHLHDSPLHNSPAFRTADGQPWKMRYEYAYANRDGACVYIDSDDRDAVNINSQTVTTSVSKQAGYHMNLADAGTATDMARHVSDILSGSDNSGEGYGGVDLSANVGWLFDGSTFTNPKAGSKLLSTQARGFVSSIVSSNSQQPIIVQLDDQPNLPTTGTLAQDATFGAVDDVESIVFQPVNQQSNGFIGLHIIGYKNVSGGESQVYLKLLSGIAHSNQWYTPATGHRWSITDSSGGTINVDHDQDGVQEDAYTDGHTDWTNGLFDFYDKVDGYLATSSETNVMRAINTIGGSFVLKRSTGLPTSFNYKGALDSPFSEEMEGNFNMSPADSAGTHEYDTSNVDLERGCRSMAWGASLIRSNPGGNIGKRVRGQVFDIACWGPDPGGDYDDVNELDAVYLLFFWALGKLIPPTVFMSNMADAQGRPVMIEECFVDLDTNYTTPDPIGTYDDGGGGNGSAGYPVGAWTFASADFGERGYIRRVGNWLIAINMADPPVSYPSTYSPTQLSGFTPRNPEDTITPTDFTALETAGVIDSSDVLTEYDPANYVNQRVSDAFAAANPSTWMGWSYGPRQPHPHDANSLGGTYTLSTTPAIARNSRNDGSTVNRGSNYGLAPLEARLWRIS